MSVLVSDMRDFRKLDEVVCRQFFFVFQKILEDISPFCGATDTPFMDFWWCLFWISKPEWATLFVLGRGACVTQSLRLTCGTTPADLLAWQLSGSLPGTCKQALVGLKTRIYHATTVREMLYRLSYACSYGHNTVLAPKAFKNVPAGKKHQKWIWSNNLKIVSPEF